GTAFIQRYPARFRRSRDPAPSLGQWRPAHPAKAAALRPEAAARLAAPPGSADPPADAVVGRDQRLLRADPGPLSVQRSIDHAVEPGRCFAVLSALWGRRVARRLRVARLAAGICAQSAAGARPARREGAVAAAGLERRGRSLPAHAQDRRTDVSPAG